MNLDRTQLLAILRRTVFVFDVPLLLALVGLGAVSTITMYSAGVDYTGRVPDHLRNLAISFALMWFVAAVPMKWIMRGAVPVYLLGLVLLVGVAMFGDIAKGARRWLDLGFTRIQPSELMKIAMPLMLAWFFQLRSHATRWPEFLVASLLLAVPVALILRQPDLGTALLVAAAGAYTIFFAGLSWRVILVGLIGLVAMGPLLWGRMHDYQRHRVLTLFDPWSDPLGKGFHIIQSTIAVGSGGIWGKGWMQGTQAHLEFVPERTTDFVFAVYGEEFGLVGNGVLLAIYVLIIARGLMIAANGATVFSRLLAGAITMVLFTYAFVNMGMVTGILPVVGVPLPFMSYGGTAMVTLGVGMGLLMAVSRQRRILAQN